MSDPLIKIVMTPSGFNCFLLHEEQESDREQDSERQRQPCDPGHVKQSRTDVADKRNACNRDRIWKLCLNMVYMITMCTRR